MQTSTMWVVALADGTSRVYGAAIVLISVTVIEAVLNRRSERRWRLLAQYALLELAEASHDAWEVLAIVFHDDNRHSSRTADSGRITEILDSPDRAPSLKRTLEAILAEPSKRDELQRSLEETLDTSRELISRWAVVLTGSSATPSCSTATSR